MERRFGNSTMFASAPRPTLPPDDSVTFRWFVKQLRNLSAFEIQVWLNDLAEKGCSEAVVRQCFSNVRAITHMARKQKYLVEDPEKM